MIQYGPSVTSGVRTQVAAAAACGVATAARARPADPRAAAQTTPAPSPPRVTSASRAAERVLEEVAVLGAHAADRMGAPVRRRVRPSPGGAKRFERRPARPPARARARRARWRSGRRGRGGRARRRSVPLGVAIAQRRRRLEVALAPVRAPAEAVHELPRRRGSTARTPSPRTCARRRRPCRARAPGSAARRRPATKRTSIGKLTWKPCASISSRTPRTAAAACSRGSAYSISVKRTRRGLANTRSERSTRVCEPATRDTSRLSRGIWRGKRRPEPAQGAEDVVGRAGCPPRHARARPGGARRLVRAVVRARERQRRVREREELEVLVVVDQLVERVERLLERGRAVDAAQRERRHAPQRHRGDHAERAEADARRAPGVGSSLGRAAHHVPVAQSRARARPTCAEMLRSRAAGAVGGGRHRAGERLDVDVAEVLEREAVPGERARSARGS